MMRPDAVEAWMLRIAEAADTSVHELVFVIRKVLTEVHTQAFEDGYRAAASDATAMRHINQNRERSDIPTD